MTPRNETDAGSSGENDKHTIEPVEVAVLLSLIFDGMSQMRPDLKMILKSRGINEDRFSQDVRQMMTAMVTATYARGDNGK